MGNIPAAPSTLVAVAAGYDDDGTDVGTPDEVYLYWYWPAHDGGADITRFRIEVKTSDGSWPSATATGETGSAALVNLDTNKNGVAYVANATVRTNQTTGGYEFRHVDIP